MVVEFLYTFTNGTVANAIRVNQNFTDVDYRQLSTDSVGGDNNSTTPTLEVTYNISANTVRDFIEINIDKNHYYVYDQGNYGAKYYYIRIDIGETGSETTKKTYSETNISINIEDCSTLKYYYEPTSDEKTNGFNIKIYLYVGDIQGGDVGSAKSKITDSWVMGK